MTLTQSFQIAGTTTRTTHINVEHIQGHNVVFWEDIEIHFPGLHHLQKADSAVNMLRDDNGIRYVPHRIKHCPGEVLDIVLHPPPGSAPVDSLTAASGVTLTHSPANPVANTPSSTLSESVPNLAVASVSFSSTEPQRATPASDNITVLQDILHSVTKAAVNAVQAKQQLDPEQMMALLYAKLAGASKSTTGFENTVNGKLDDAKTQQTSMNGKLDDIFAMTQQILMTVNQLQNQMILIQNKTQAILTQQIELDEYPIPRLFIVLPEERIKYDPSNWFRTKFRLHFICECGDHTQSTGSRIPNHLHLARHEGYLVREPIEFFKKYGPFLLLMLELIKSGTNIAGHVVPALANQKAIEMGSVQQTVEAVSAKIDYSLQCIISQMSNLQDPSLGDMTDRDYISPMTHSGLARYLSDIKGLEGVELRQLGSFLKASNGDSLFGNLYRITTSDGHVKWICDDHYRVVHQETSSQKLRDVVNLSGGTFDEQLGKVNITLGSSVEACEFYGVLCDTKAVFELIVEMRWNCTVNDIDALQDAIRRSFVSFLAVDLRQFQPRFENLWSSIPGRYTVLYRLLDPINLKAVHLVLPNNLLSLSNFTPKRPSHLHCLTFEIVIGESDCKDISTLAEVHSTGHIGITLYQQDTPIEKKGASVMQELLKTNSTQTTLDLSGNTIGDKGAQTLSEALKTNSTLTTLELWNNSIGDKGAQALSEALKTNSALITLHLGSNSIAEIGVDALSKALKTNCTLTTLNLWNNSIGNIGVQALSEALKTNSTLITLKLGSNSIGEIGVHALSEALKINSTLITLSLWHNSIGNKGTQALSEALRANSTLITLNLGSSAIGDIGARALSEALKTNSTLITLALQNNSIGDRGAQALSEALKTNSTLITLKLGSNSIGEIGAQALSEALKTNPKKLTILQ